MGGMGMSPGMGIAMAIGFGLVILIGLALLGLITVAIVWMIGDIKRRQPAQAERRGPGPAP